MVDSQSYAHSLIMFVEERLAVEKTRLEVERSRLEVDKCRLEIEEQRWAWQQKQHRVEM